MRLQNKTIIVTGSTTGIGKAIATRCVAEGARVLIHGRDEQRGREVVEQLGERAALHIDDLADAEAPTRIAATALEKLGSIDAVVNNAAFVTRSDIHSTDAALFDKVMAVNVRAAMLLIQAALPQLEANGGCVLNIGSVNYYCGEANLLAYSVSKGALVTLSRNLGDWLHRKHGVRVNHINVGWTLTENEYDYKIADGLPPDWPDRIPRSRVPAGRLLKPEEIAAAAVYWLSDESKPVSGSVFDFDQFPVVGHIPEKEVE